VSDRSGRSLGEVSVINDPGITGTVDVDLVAQTLAALSTDLGAALASAGTDEVRVTSPGSLTVNVGAESAGLASEATLSTTESNTSTTASALSNEANLAHGRQAVTTAGTAVQMPSQSIPDGKAIALVGIRGNTGDCYVGGSTVDSTNGIPLAAGQVLTLQVQNLDSIYIDAANDGDEVGYLVEAA
jgi:hypothetical protein